MIADLSREKLTLQRSQNSVLPEIIYLYIISGFTVRLFLLIRDQRSKSLN